MSLTLQANKAASTDLPEGSVFQPHSVLPDVFVHTKEGGHFTCRENADGHLVFEPIQNKNGAGLRL